MFPVIAGLIVVALIGVSLYCFLKMRELETVNAALSDHVAELEEDQSDELESLKNELAKLSRFAHIPGVIERAKAEERATAAKVEQANREAARIIDEAAKRAERVRERILRDAKAHAEKASEVLRVAELKSSNLVDEANREAKRIASEARKEAKEKVGKVDDQLRRASIYALEIRQKAEKRAEAIAGEALDAKRKHDQYAAAYQALQNAMSGYVDSSAIPSDHLLDELADEYAFHEAGEKLKLARERTRIMQEQHLAADCNYPEGWKRDYAISFVLSAFNGKVDSILARIKPANHGKMAQEIKDTFATVNHNGEVFKGARIQEEYLDARLQELRWGVAVQRVKERQREEQRAIREQMREEERARKEFERAIKQAEREEAAINQAIDRVRQELERASEQERAAYEAQLEDLNAKFLEAEARNQRAISMAQQTKCGHVYIISNIGSFGDDVYKIGLTRRLEPTDRVRELSGASVPFPFDIHAMIYSDDAPALEAALHRRFVTAQVNKANKRKEFFRVKLRDLREAVEELGLSARWTITADATDYKETLSIERAMESDAEFARHWREDQEAYEASQTNRDDEESEEELEETLSASQGDD
ncbi:GIY-YIG nuclease family protein [Tautonia rosea]|uniref:GIY-YIG nuclease family protein n=1 Tax=Tautonia rosea TaxID=2728037 RepID=UPI001474A148|nr:GIY-YIG nuclease family protein [Tautonia rosea]